ncbi:MAG: ribosome biogenesis GTPase Der, partial [Candidatus Peregrinibacteria bacterium]|nr:ribosome biogenesis GTPase Der [Candidatus Peregrinibacteria bacterium]
IVKERRKRIPTAKLNTFVEQIIQEHKPTGKGRVHPKIYYITQPEVEPPRFIVFVNKKSSFHFSYVRYIENKLREKFTFTGSPIKIEYREKERESK